MAGTLMDQINYEKAYRENRLNAALWVLEHPDTFPELLDICLDPGRGDLAHKACWALEFVCKEDLSILYPHFDLFFERLEHMQTDQTLRPLAHICEMIVLRAYKKKDPLILEAFKPRHKELMTNNCFDWMITPQKVACQARAMLCLYFLGTEENWIHPELKEILLRDLHKGSAGYQNRGKKMLQKIEVWATKT